MALILSRGSFHDSEVSEVMSELAADYFPGVRILEESTTALPASSALEVVKAVSAPLRRTVRIQSGFARHATVAGVVVKSEVL